MCVAAVHKPGACQHITLTCSPFASTACAVAAEVPGGAAAACDCVFDAVFGSAWEVCVPTVTLSAASVPLLCTAAAAVPLELAMRPACACR